MSSWYCIWTFPEDALYWYYKNSRLYIQKSEKSLQKRVFHMVFMGRSEEVGLLYIQESKVLD
jgi:hypothetical protein